MKIQITDESPIEKQQPLYTDDEVYNMLVANGTFPKIDTVRDWTLADAFKAGIHNVLDPTPHALADYEDQRLIGLSPEEFEQKAGGYRPLGALDPALRDEFLRGEIASRGRFDTMMKGIADYIAPPPDEPYKEPEGFWDKALYKTIEAIPNIGATAAEMAAIGLPLTLGHQTFSGNDAAKETVYRNLVAQGMSPEQAYNVATDRTLNMQDLALRGLTNWATMRFLNKTPVANVGGMSPYMQAAGNIGAAMATSGIGSAAEQAVTNARADMPNDPLELAKTGGLSALTTGALGAIGAFRNRRYLREQQNIHNAIRNADFTDLGEVPPETGGLPSAPDTPNEPPSPQGGMLPATGTETTGRIQTVSDVMMKHGLNPQGGSYAIAAAYRNGFIDDTALDDIASTIMPDNPTLFADDVKANAADMPPLVRAENVPVGDLLTPQVSKGMGTEKPQVQRYANGLIPDYVEGRYAPKVQKPDIADPLFAPPRSEQTVPVPVTETAETPAVEKVKEKPWTPEPPVSKMWTDPLKSNVEPAVPTAKQEPNGTTGNEKAKNHFITDVFSDKDFPELKSSPTGNTAKTAHARPSYLNTGNVEAKINDYGSGVEIEFLGQRANGIARNAQFPSGRKASHEEREGVINGLLHDATPELEQRIHDYFGGFPTIELREKYQGQDIRNLTDEDKREILTAAEKEIERIMGEPLSDEGRKLLEEQRYGTMPVMNDGLGISPEQGIARDTNTDTGNNRTAREKGSISELIDFIKTGDGRKNASNAVVKFAPVTKEQAEAISRATGEKIDEKFTHVIDGGYIFHALNRHGNDEKLEHQSPVTEDDLKMLPEIVSNPDKIEPAGVSKTGFNSVAFSKRIDGHILVVEAVRSPNKKKTLAVTSVRKIKAGYYIDFSTPELIIRKEKANPPVLTSDNDSQQPNVERTNAVSNAESLHSDGVNVNGRNAEFQPIFNIPKEGKFKAPYYLGLREMTFDMLHGENYSNVVYKRMGEQEITFKPSPEDPSVIEFFNPLAKFSKKPVAIRDKEGNFKSLNPEVHADEIEAAFNEYLQSSTGENVSKAKSPVSTVSAVPASAEPVSTEDDIVSKSQQLADKVKEAISSGSGIKNNNDLASIASRIFGGTRGQGVHTVKDDYDAMEMGVNKFIMESGINPSAANEPDSAEADLARILDIMKLLPTHANRTEEQVKLQQFSTPPNLAYVVNWLANIQKGDTVLEPSAGLGGLAVFAKNAGANVILNEYSPRRAKLLKSMNLGEVYKEDALSLNNILSPRFKKEGRRLPNKVIMNPPFSVTTSAGKKSSSNAITHVEQALKFMENGGRLVAILGKGTTSKPEWKKIANNYNVRAVYDLDGSNYYKYGTSYDNQIVVIDKTPVDHTNKTVHINLPSSGHRNLEMIFYDLEDIRNSIAKTERPQYEETHKAAPEVPAESVTPVTETKQAASTPAPNKGEEKTVAPKSVKRETGQPVSNSGTSPKVSKKAQLPDEKKPEVLAEWEKDGKKRRSIDEIVKREETSKITVKKEADLGKEQKTALEKEAELNQKRGTPAIASRYITSINAGTPHPANVNETIALSAQALPPLKNASITLPKEMIESGAISSAQLEVVAYALQACEETNTIDGVDYNCAAFLADGTGMGKGRTIAAFIHAIMAKGYGSGKAVWVSVDAKKNGLFKEGQGHYADIGDDPHDMFSQTLMPPKSKITRDNGVLFTAYSTLRNKEGSGSDKFPRFEQMCDWLGDDFDGAIVLDECHTANNIVSTKGKRGKTKTSDTADIIFKLQKKYPKAKVLYASATGATELKQLAAYPRLGIWGENQSFINEAQFRNALEQTGLAGMELIIRSLKAQGRWFARSLSMEDVTFRTLHVPLTEQQTLIYNEVGRAWRAVQDALNDVGKVVGMPDGKVDGKVKAAFHGARQKAMNMLITYFKVPSMITDMEKQLEAGSSVIVQLTNTNEVRQNAVKKTAETEDSDNVNFNVSPISSLINFLNETFPVYELETYLDENEKEHVRVKTDSNGDPIISAEAHGIRDELIANIKSIKFQNPLDMIINHFGVNNVVEVTGRSERQVDTFEDMDGTRVKTGTTTQKWGKDYGMADKKNFDDGKKRILIFSEAGSTGVSYHAGRQFKNQQKRVHYLLQAGWRAETAMQGLGRSHRTNQAQAPEYVLVSTDVPGERRFLSSIARRLLQLGALSSGERKSTTQGIFSEKDNLESREAKEALKDLVNELLSDRTEENTELIRAIDPPRDSDGHINEKELDFSKMFNGLLAVDVATQKRVYAKFDRYLNSEIQNALDKGILDTGTENMKGEHIRLKEEVSSPKKGINAIFRVFEIENTARYRTWNKLNMKIKYADAKGNNKEESLTPNDFKFYVKKSNGEIFAAIEGRGENDTVINTARGESEPLYLAFSPKQKVTIPESILKGLPFKMGVPASDAYTEIGSIEEAKSLWDKYVERLPKVNKSQERLLSGSLLPVLGLFPSDKPIKVQRAVTDDKKQYLGVVMPKNAYRGILHALEIEAQTDKHEKYTPKTLREALSKTKEAGAYIGFKIGTADTITLCNKTVNGEKRIKINVPFFYKPTFQRNFGMFSERVEGSSYDFIPDNDEILQKLIDRFPDMKLRGERSENDDSWESINELGVRKLNDGIIDDEDIFNMYFISPSFRRFFGFGATPAEAMDNAENNPDVISVPPEYQSTDPEVERRQEEAHEQHRAKPSPVQYAADFASKVWRGTSRAYELEGKPHMAKALNITDQLKQTRRATVQQVEQAFRVIFDKLTPDDYTLFERYMLAQDLAETYASDERVHLPYGYTPETLAADYERYENEVDKNPKVKEAVKKAESYGEKLRRDLIREADKLGLYDVRDKLKRKHYFRHLVLDYYLVSNGGNVPYSTMKNPTRKGFLMKREGSYKDISSNWIQAMGEVYVRMLDCIKVMGALSQLREEYDVIEQLKEYANAENMERALYRTAERLKDIPADGLKEAALNKLNKELLSTRAKAVSKIFKLAQKGDLPVGLSHQWEELVHNMAEAGQLENLNEDDREKMSRYVAWLVNNKVEAMITPSMEITSEAQRAAKHILKGEAIKRRRLEKMLGSDYLKWQDLIPEGYRLWSPSDSNLIAVASSVPEYALKIAEENLDEMLGIPLSDICKALQSGGNKQIWIIPEDIADFLDRMGKKQPLGSFGKLNKYLMTNFKKWTLLNPFNGRLGLYNLRNFFGDFEAVLQGNPMAVRYIPRAIKELKHYMLDGAIPTGMLKEFADRGGALVTEFTSELDEWSNLKDFKNLVEKKKGNVNILKLPAKFVHAYTDIVSLLTNYREAVLRYASFLSFYDLINENGGTPPFYGMSKPMEVDAMKADPIGMAFKLSNENLGAFDEVSENTQYLRDNSLMTFISWLEVNFKRTMQMYKNTLSGNDYVEYYAKRAIKSLTGGGGGNDKIPPASSGLGNGYPDEDGDIRKWRRRLIETLKKSPVMGLRYLILLAKLSPMMLILSMLNRMNPNEKKLPGNIREEPHLTLWENAFSGNVYVLTGLSSAFDFLETDPSHIFCHDMKEILAGRQTVGGMLSDMASAPMNKALNYANPILKFAIESVTGVKTYPDYRERVKIKDPLRYLAQSLNLGWYYDAATGRPHKPFSDIMPSVSGKGMDSYFYILGRKKVFQEQVLGLSSGGFTETPRTEALRNARMAIAYDYAPEEVNKYIADFYNKGGQPSGIKQSLTAIAPTAGLTTANKAKFWAWLSEDDRKQLEIAERFHKYISAWLKR